MDVLIDILSFIIGWALVIGGAIGALVFLVWIFLAPFSKKIDNFCRKFFGGDKGGFWWPGMMH